MFKHICGAAFAGLIYTRVTMTYCSRGINQRVPGSNGKTKSSQISTWKMVEREGGGV